MAKPNLKELGRRVAHIGTRQLELKKKIEAEIAAVRQQMVEMSHQPAEPQVMPAPIIYLTQDVIPPPGPRPIPYAPIFNERWRQTHRLWREDVISHLENLVYVGENEDGVPVMADFEIQVPLPVVYLITARQAGNRVKWIREHPYDEWKEEILKEKKWRRNDEAKATH